MNEQDLTIEKAVFILFVGLSFFGNSAASFAIVCNGYFSISSRLALYLHLTEIILDISTFPFYYFGSTSSTSWCAFIGFMQAYSGLANSVTILCMSVFVYETVFDFTLIPIHHMKREIWMTIVVFTFPLISSLGYIKNGVFGLDHTYWCFFTQTVPGVDYAYGLFFVWIFAITIIVASILSYILWKFRSFPNIQFQIFQFLGLYSVVNLTFWVLRALMRLSSTFLGSEEFAYFTFLVSYFGGIASVGIYILQRKNLIAAEERAVAAMGVAGHGTAHDENMSSSVLRSSSTKNTEMWPSFIESSHMSQHSRSSMGGPPSEGANPDAEFGLTIVPEGEVHSICVNSSVTSGPMHNRESNIDEGLHQTKSSHSSNSGRWRGPFT